MEADENTHSPLVTPRLRTEADHKVVEVRETILNLTVFTRITIFCFYHAPRGFRYLRNGSTVLDLDQEVERSY